MCKRKKTGIIFLLLCLMLFAACSLEAKAKIKKIKVSVKDITIGVGESKKLKVTVKPKKEKNKLKFKSFNNRILKISKNGTITGKKKGTTYVLVRAKGNKKKRAKVKVTVVQKVKKVTLTNKSKIENKTYFPDMTISLKTVVYPKTASNKILKWKSDNPAVATVNEEGIVTAQTSGTTTITATTTDGTKKKISCKIKVRIPVSKIVLEENKNFLHMKLGEERKLERTILPKEADNKKLSWISTNEEVATVSSNGTVTANKLGTAIIVATAKDGSETVSAITIKVSELGIEEPEEKKDTNVKFIAHRGLSSLAPENTLAAFQLAVDNDFWGVECDVWQTKDGEFVISHDESLKKMCGVDEKVTELTLEEIKMHPIIKGNGLEEYPGEYIPSLREYLDVVARDGDAYAVIELKMDTITEESAMELMNLLDEFAMRNRTVVISFSEDCVQKVKEADCTKLVKRQFLTENVTEEIMDWCVENKMGLSCKYSKITEENINLAKEKGVEVGVWTVDDYDIAYQFINEYGIDYLTSNEKLFSEKE